MYLLYSASLHIDNELFVISVTERLILFVRDVYTFHLMCSLLLGHFPFVG